ncbi:TIGR03089 family protein [Sinomonas mesophila]|uniref:TIGR03089 family protein n=1 Tax=Sinomonas mesophila TaxID=1531955 RepID=UPI00098618E5|nr:TIGR03089 family protein [Sinomonas mesophila]
MASTILDLLHHLRSGNSGAPRLTWYGPGGERVELSGRVLDNWVSKTSNFLTEELDAEPGTRVRLGLPPHWKTAVVALAAWQAGAVIVDDGDADVTFVGPPGAAGTSSSDAPSGGAAAHGGSLIAVALGALETAYPGPLPGGALDYAALVRQFADSFDPFDVPAPGDEALRTQDGSFTQSSLLSGFATPTPSGARVLITAGDGLPAVLAGLLGAWAADGSAVLLHPEVEATEHLRRIEQVTG